MSGGNSGNFLSPKNLIPAVLTGGLSTVAYGFNSLKRAATPDAPPNPGSPPSLVPPPTPSDTNPVLTAQQRAKKLAALQFGMASTITSKTNASLAPTAMPGLKAKLGQ